MEYKDLVNSWKRFGSTPEDVCQQVLGVSADEINERVIIAPWWKPEVFDNLGYEKTFLNNSDDADINVWSIKTDDYNITYIQTGIGAPVLSDAVLALGGTKCYKAIFVGSVGALDDNISIGDIVIPKLSICGDGMSRYLKGSPLKDNDAFGEVSYPDKEMYEVLKSSTKTICEENNIKWHVGTTFSIDTIVAQFAYIDEILQMDCNVIEMETAAAFRAASIVNIKLAALFSVSDNTMQNKSLICEINENENIYRKEVRKSIFPKIILKTLK